MFLIGALLLSGRELRAEDYFKEDLSLPSDAPDTAPAAIRVGNILCDLPEGWHAAGFVGDRESGALLLPDDAAPGQCAIVLYHQEPWLWQRINSDLYKWFDLMLGDKVIRKLEADPTVGGKIEGDTPQLEEQSEWGCARLHAWGRVTNARGGRISVCLVAAQPGEVLETIAFAAEENVAKKYAPAFLQWSKSVRFANLNPPPESTEGDLRLENIYRSVTGVQAIGKGVVTSHTLCFYADGHFEEQGVMEDTFHPEGRSATAAGLGTYIIQRDTLTLRYTEGTVRKCKFAITPDYSAIRVDGEDLVCKD